MSVVSGFREHEAILLQAESQQQRQRVVSDVPIDLGLTCELELHPLKGAAEAREVWQRQDQRAAGFHQPAELREDVVQIVDVLQDLRADQQVHRLEIALPFKR